MLRLLVAVILCFWTLTQSVYAQPRALGPRERFVKADSAPPVVLKPSRVWDGLSLEAHDQWIVIVRGQTIEAAGPAAEVKVPKTPVPSSCQARPCCPGLIDAHTHVLLHPYDEALWDDQVLKEALALRVCRATNHLSKILASGFTTIRDFGTEGAGYADVGLKQAVAQGIIPARGWWL